MMAVANYSEYINYCKLSINCITSKNSKLKYRNFVNFSSTIFKKFAAGMMQEQNKLYGDGDWDKTCWGGDGDKVCGDRVGMGTVLWEQSGDGDE